MKAVLIGFVAFSLLGKILIHLDLDKKHKKFKGGLAPGFIHPYYFLPYYESVERKFQREKSICNLLYSFMWISVMAIIIYSFITGSRLR
jgi:hypothetical protein